MDYPKAIIEIAIIAVIRHILVLDYEHVDSSLLIGLSGLIFVLGLFYLFMNDKFKISKKQN